MNGNDDTCDVLDVVKHSFDGVTMRTGVDAIVAAGRGRRRRRRLAGAAGGLATGTGVGLGVLVPGAEGPSGTVLSTGTDQVRVHAAAFEVRQAADGTLHVSWDKERYFKDPAGLQQALAAAGFPVIVRTGEFCKGPGDDGRVDASGSGPGVRAVVTGERTADDRVNLIFRQDALPPGTQLFIGYLSPAPLAVTGGQPGSVERLVPISGPLTCTSELPTFPPRADRGVPAGVRPAGAGDPKKA